ncbi:MAG TPA: 1,2-phenylacetyl-CoA epoxidase subunit PaaD [Acetobacteraceae bacterium]
MNADATLRERAEAAAGAVPDPELPFLTIAELGILRGVAVRDGVVEVAITPTYTGCVATQVIAADVATALLKAGIDGARVRTVLAPAWTTAWLTEGARAKLLKAGIAPPGFVVRDGMFDTVAIACPHCGSLETERLSAFGSTPCKALHRCNACREPFEAFKCL